MRKPRHISPDDQAMWDAYKRHLTPLHAARKPDTAPDMVEPPTKVRVNEPAPLPKFQVGARADLRRPHDIAPPLREQLSTAPLQMDAKAHRKLTQGKAKPEGRIDLHGMTLDQAHPALIDFILRAHASGKRTVLVITGKGKRREEHGNMPTRQGILRHQVPSWLRLAPLAHVVLQITPAHLRHGGEGAYYITLRRTR
jgi:DNA-nicking Smr family endonuclease